MRFHAVQLGTAQPLTCACLAMRSHPGSRVTPEVYA